jgi:hypothetical protein
MKLVHEDAEVPDRLFFIHNRRHCMSNARICFDQVFHSQPCDSNVNHPCSTVFLHKEYRSNRIMHSEWHKCFVQCALRHRLCIS